VDLLAEHELKDQERQLCQMAARGRLLDLRCRRADEDAPVSGRRWTPDRHIRPQVVYQLLTGRGELDKAFGTPVAVRVRGAQISGNLNLGSLALRCPLELYECYICGRLGLTKTTTSDISLRGSYLAKGLTARRLLLDHNLNLGKLRSAGRTRLIGAHIGGQLNCDRATFSNPNGRALNADGINAGGAVSFRDAQVSGEIRLLGAHIGGQLNCGRATFSNLDGRALYADGLTCNGDMRLDNAQVTGEIRLLGAHIGGQLNCDRATLTNPDGDVVTADGLTCDGDVLLDNAQITGEIRLLSARLGGQLSCDKATLTNSDGDVLSADGLTCDGDVLLDNAQITGGIRLLSARLGGQLSCDEATLTNPDGRALNAEGLTADSDVFLRDADVTGEIRLLGAHIGGQLTCDKATLTNPDGQALNADGLTCDGDVLLDNAQITGGIRLLSARLGGQLSCDEATLTNPDGRALNAEGLTADSDVFLRDADVTGEIRLFRAHIGGQLTCDKATLTNPDGQALNADGLTADSHVFLRDAQVTGEIRLLRAQISGQLSCNKAILSNSNGLAVDLERSVTGPVRMTPSALQGGFDLTHAKVAAWFDDQEAWPTQLHLEGFTYEAIDAPGVSVQKRIAWLRLHHGGYIPQPYEQLAAVYRRDGDDASARVVAIAKQQSRRSTSDKWWTRWPNQVWSVFLRRTIGYGYRPALVLPYFIALFVVGSVVLGGAYPRYISDAKVGSSQPAFNAARYTFDLLLPVANLKQRDAFIPHGYAAWWVFGLTFAGWLLAAVLVAGLTGVFKRD
jgi:hypothetical protein